MKKYRVSIAKTYDIEFEIEAENEEEAEEIANEKFNELNISGIEMYYANSEVEEEENE